MQVAIWLSASPQLTLPLLPSRVHPDRFKTEVVKPSHEAFGIILKYINMNQAKGICEKNTIDLQEKI